MMPCPHRFQRKKSASSGNNNNHQKEGARSYGKNANRFFDTFLPSAKPEAFMAAV